VSEYDKHKAWAENLSIVLQLGLTMAGCIVCCFFAGRYLDRWLGTRGVLTVLLTLFGVVGGGVVSYRQISEILVGRDGSDDTSAPGNDSPP
jgi:hypothetical protein